MSVIDRFRRQPTNRSAGIHPADRKPEPSPPPAELRLKQQILSDDIFPTNTDEHQ